MFTQVEHDDDEISRACIELQRGYYLNKYGIMEFWQLVSP